MVATASRPARARPRRRIDGGFTAPAAEALEERIALAVFAVTNTNDTGPGSFRQAIRDANTGVNRADTIIFDRDYFSTPREILIHGPEQFSSVAGPLTIVGPGSHLLTLRAAITPNRVYSRVLDSFAPVLTISGMKVIGGNTTAGGGGLYCAAGSNVTLDDMVFVDNVADNGGAIALASHATLTIRNSRLSGNRAGVGGGIYFFDGGSLVMDNCTVSGNTTTRATQWDASGGGIYFFGNAKPAPLPAGFIDRTLLIRNSTFGNNTAFGGGGGIALDWVSGTLLVRNSTLSGNTAGSSGGGIYSTSQATTITVENCTITGNSANQSVPLPNPKGGGGISRVTDSGTVNVINSVVSGNTNAGAPDILSHPQSPVTVRYSAVGSAAGFTMAAGSGNNLPFGANLLLGPLADNGGRTLTHLPQGGSPLVNAGSNALVPAELTNDQRGPGFPRTVGSSVDIGSVERPLPQTPPQVAAVFVSNAAAWSDAFKAFMQGRALGDVTHGYSVPGGADQLKTLPWVGLNRVSIRFSHDVAADMSDLAVTGVNTASYAVADYGYDPSTFTATWYLAQPLRNDRVTLHLDADPGGVAGATGRLDGEWADGSRAYPSGDGTAGGDFRFRLNVLPGDVDRNGSVLANDYSAVKSRFFQNTSSPNYTAFHDVDGSGSILANDYSEVKRRFFNVLPAAAAAPVSGTGRITSQVLNGSAG